MATINLPAPVMTADRDLYRVQQRFEQPLRQLISTPWGDGVLVPNLMVLSISGDQTLRVKHNLGRPVTGAVLWSSSVPIYGPWNVVAVDPNVCSITVNTPVGVPAGNPGTIAVWVG